MLFARRFPVAPLAFALAVLALAAPGCGRSDVTPAFDAAAFRDSFGIQTHIAYADTPYARWPALVARLDEIGIDHLRDGLYANPARAAFNERFYRAVELAAAHGKRFTFGTGPPGWGQGTLPELVAVAAGRLRPAVDAIEGPNEYDLTSGLRDWTSPLRAFLTGIARAVRSEPRLRGVPVVGPSLGRMQASAGQLGDVSAALDEGNMHPYTGGQAPTQQFVRDQLALARLVSRAKPVVATEAGFHNALDATVGQPPVPEDVAAGYTLRTFLEHFRAGIPRTFVYELVDEGSSQVNPEKSFGLLRSDLSEKPAFTALKRLLRVLGRPKPLGGTPRGLELTVGAGVEQLLLQRAPSGYQLILWQARSTWDTDTRRRLVVPPRRIAVELPADTVTIARPVQSGAQTALRLRAGRGTVDVGADPVVLSFRARRTGG